MTFVQDTLTLLADLIALLGLIYLAAGFVLVTTASASRQPELPQAETPAPNNKWKIADPGIGDIAPIQQAIKVEAETELALPLLPPAAEPEPETQTTALILDEIASIKLRPARLVCSQLGIPQKRHRKSRPLADLREEILQHFLSNQQVVITALEAAKAG